MRGDAIPMIEACAAHQPHGSIGSNHIRVIDEAAGPIVGERYADRYAILTLIDDRVPSWMEPA